MTRVMKRGGVTTITLNRPQQMKRRTDSGEAPNDTSVNEAFQTGVLRANLH